MELYTKEILAIFKSNFEYPIVQTPIGEAVQMDAINAFLFSNITGAGYFDNPTFLFSPKGTQKTLREAFQYNLVTGIYNGAELFYSPSELASRRPYLFKGKKFVVFKEFTDECQLAEDLQDEYDLLIEKGHNPTDYIIARIEASKNGNGMEPFLEYLACEYFKKRGYIVENQVPLAATVGSPDFGGYHISNSNLGFHINELALIRITKNFDITKSLTVDSIIVGEAKTSTTIMEKQLRKYLNTELFSTGYELHPDKPTPSIDSFGLLNISRTFNTQVIEPARAYVPIGKTPYDRKEYIGWIHQYIKFYLIANLTQSEFSRLLQERTGKRKCTIDNAIDVIKGMSITEILKKLQEVM